MKNAKYFLLVLIIIGGAFFLSSVFSGQNKSDLRKDKKKPAKSEKTVIIKNENHTKVVSTSGRMRAFHRVEIYAEVTGVLKESSINFKSGNRFKKGEKMIEINSDVYYNSLLAQKGNLLNLFARMLADAKVDFPESYEMWKEYIGNFKLTEPLKPLPENLTQKEMYYLSTHNILKSFYDVKSMEETYSKYTIRAPFDGYVTLSSINPGTLVRSGQKLGEFLSPTVFEMEAPVKISELNFLSVGDKAELTTYDNDKIYVGKIVRINRAIDSQSQSVKIIIRSTDKGIIDGMFFNVTVKSKSPKKLAKLPVSAVGPDNTVLVKIGNETKKLPVKVDDRLMTAVFVEGLEDNTEVIINGNDD